MAIKTVEFLATPSPDLQARENLEQQKLNAQIEQIRLQIQAEREKLGNERAARRRIDWKAWVPILLSALTIFLTAITVGRELVHYLDQRAREHAVTLNEHMIDIAQKLADPTADPLQSRTNAVLLSTFEEDALPVLFEHLRASTAASQGAILHALELIQRNKNVKQGAVARELLTEARHVFARYDADIEGTANFVIALGRLAADERQDAIELLAELRQRVRRQGGAPTGILTPMIDEARRQLASAAR